ncbi:MAG: hypothetical protein WAN65_20180, partial [Candidatus Sulfotelmatobacter sp.]
MDPTTPCVAVNSRSNSNFEKTACTSPVGVILSVAVFQAERRTSRLTGPARKPNCTTTEIQNPRKPNL